MTLSNDFTSWDSSGNTDFASLLKMFMNSQNGQSANAPIQFSQPSDSSGGFGNNIAGALKSLAAYGYNAKGQKLEPQQGTVGQIGNLANAQIDQSNPLFQQIYGQEKGAAQQNLSEAIAEAARQNSKLSMLGRTPLFNPERGGETQFRTLTQGYQTVQDTARERARQILGAGQSAQNNLLTAQNNLSQQQDLNNKKKAFSVGNIADSLPLLLKLFK